MVLGWACLFTSIVCSLVSIATHLTQRDGSVDNTKLRERDTVDGLVGRPCGQGGRCWGIVASRATLMRRTWYMRENKILPPSHNIIAFLALVWCKKMLLYYGTEEVDGNTLVSGSHVKKKPS